MVSTYSTMVLATDGDSILSGGDGQPVLKRADVFNATRDNRGMMVIDKTSEDVKNVAVPISGLDKLQAQSQEQLSSVSRIPLSIYLQITPTGLNASSEGETRSFYADVKSLQEDKLDPLLRPVIDVVMLSLWGEIDPDISYEWQPLWEMSDKDKADVRKSDAEADVAYIDAGVVTNEEARERLRTDDASLYHGVDLSGPAPEIDLEQDDEEAGTEADVPFGDSWNEGDHPRDENGRFSDGGSSAIARHVSNVLSGRSLNQSLDLGPVTTTNADLVSAHTGFDLTGHTRIIDSSGVRHAMNRHSDEAKEAEIGQVAIAKRDFSLIPQIVEQAHSVKLKGEPRSAKAQRLEYTALIGNHEYEYVEELRPNNRAVALKTMRKR